MARVLSSRIITTLHYKIHQGNAFAISTLVDNVADGANLDFLIQVGSSELHITFEGSSEGLAWTFLYENPTFSAAGTTVTPLNRARDSSIVTTATVTTAPTVSDAGTALFSGLFPGGVGNKTVGGSAAERNEWVLARNTNYLGRITNKAGATKDISFTATYYEIE